MFDMEQMKVVNITETNLTEKQITRIIEENIGDWNNYIRKYDQCKDCGESNVNKLIRNPQLKTKNVLCVKCFTRMVIRNAHKINRTIEEQKQDGTYQVKNWRLKKQAPPQKTKHLREEDRECQKKT